MKPITRFLTVLLLSALMAFALQTYLGIPPAYTFFGMIGISIVLSMVPKPAGASFMALQVELWTGELIKKFRHEHSFLSRIGSRNEFVNKNVIRMVDIGADPAVLINNTTYPIASAQRTDADIAISLDKFDTENTIITDDELYALPYDKPGSVIEQHREVLEERTAEKAIHSLCPLVGTADTPVVMTTGSSNGYTNPRKRLTIADLIKMKKYLDDLKIPQENRELVLCNQHVEDLLLVSEVFQKQFQNITTGQILNLYGFMISQFVSNPLFSDTTGQKKAFGAAASAADDLQTSVVYYNKRAVQARGDITMYHAEAKTDPKYRQSEIGFRVYHVCLPKKNTGFGAIVSTKV